jgi:hypothetical protein
MEDYTRSAWGEIVRGSRWPPAADPFTIEITNTNGWPVGADGWTWEVLLSRATAGDSPDLTLSASADLDEGVLTLTFQAAPEETAGLPGSGRTRFFVDVRSTDGSGVVSYYDCVQGSAWVRDPAGQGGGG